MTQIFNMLLHAKKLIMISFTLILALLLALLALKPAKYQAHMSFLIRNERAESIISADPNQTALQQTDLTEERINSAVALLGSTEILEVVVNGSGLEKEFLNASSGNRVLAVEKATRKLSKHLDITAVRKSDVIDVTYTSSNRDQAKQVLDSLSRDYITTYTQLHNAGGAAEFYKTKTEELKAQLLAASYRRADLLAQNGYMLLPEGQQLGLHEMVELQKSRNEVVSSLAETISRLDQVEIQKSVNSPRLRTQERTSVNPYSLEQLSTKLVELQNQRTTLRSKFFNNDPLLVEKDEEIVETQSALDRAQRVTSSDMTSDVNPIRQSLDSEANRLIQGNAGLTSRLHEIDRQIMQEKGQLRTIEQVGIEVDSLNRNIKVLQNSVDSYYSRFLSASAAEKMDPEQFSNVVEATHPTVPALPESSNFNVMTSILLATLLSLGIGLASEWRKKEIYSTAERRSVVLSSVGRG